METALPNSLRRAAGLALALGLGVAAGAGGAGTRIGAGEWSGVPRVVAVGDLHGSHEKFVRLLRGAGLADAKLRWSGGEDHLVVAGDFLDRGPEDRPLMDLLRRLQEESEDAGGRVHVLLGNHEVMNLLRDTRHVNPLSYFAFALDETRSERNAAWRASLPRDARGSDLRAFNRDYPRGFFARQRSLGPEGEYGGWLLRQPVIVKVNGVAYLHGGLTEPMAALGVEGINRRVREALGRHLTLRSELEAEGVVTALMDYWQIQLAAREAAASESGVSARARDAARQIVELLEDPILGPEGPLWYRGNSFEDERIERDVVERSLELLGATAMVVAHSYTGGNKITSRFHGQLFRVDHGILRSDRPLALVVERGEVLVLDPKANSATRPIRELPPGNFRMALETSVPDEQTLRLLRDGEVVEARELGRGSTRPRLVVLELDGLRQRGLFKSVEGPGSGARDRYQHEVAAYRLDKRLELGLVPPTVVREIEGERGSLQAWVEGAVDRAAAEAYEMKLYQSETSARQLELGRLFDALIGNDDRKPDDVLCRLEGERIYLVDHSRAFSLGREPAWSPEAGFALPERLAEALRALDSGGLERELGGLLSALQIEALLARRDRLLERAAGPGSARAVAR